MGLPLVYVVVCRLSELVVLLGRRERSKELEILVLRHELSRFTNSGSGVSVGLLVKGAARGTSFCLLC